jgi:hypothetical protein
MSRLDTLSAAALRAMFSLEADEPFIVLLTITGEGIDEPVRLADNYTHRLSETPENVTYGLVSRGEEYLFLPFSITLPDDKNGTEARCNVTLNDVTGDLMPVLRSINGAPTVDMEVVLGSDLDTVEISAPGLFLGGIGYDAGTITGELVYQSPSAEPFPAGTFTPTYFPGMF